MLSKLRLGPKLIGAFVAVALIGTLIGAVGIASLNRTHATYERVIANRVQAAINLSRLAEAQQIMWVAERGLTNRRFNEATVRKAQYEYDDKGSAQAAEAWKAYEALSHTAEEEALWKQFVPQWEEWRKLHDEVRTIQVQRDALLAQGISPDAPQVAEVDAQAFSKAMEARAACLASGKALHDLVDLNLKLVDAEDRAAQGAAQNAKTTIIGAVLLGLLLSVGLGILLARSVAIPMAQGVEMMQELGRGRLGCRLHMAREDEIGQLTGAMDKFADDLQSIVVGTLHKIADGDLSTDVVLRSPDDEIGQALATMTDSLRNVQAETRRLTAATVAGELDTRGDADRYQGAYREIVQGLNDAVDALVRPLKTMASYVDRISRGDIPEKITDSYSGEFETIRGNINRCIDGLGGLVEANAVLQRMAENDHTTPVRGQYEGVYAEVARAVNDVQERVRHISATANNIAMGDLRELDDYRALGNGKGRRSEQDELVPAFIHMMENLQALVQDAETLAASAVEGRLDVRADASRHQGEFRRVVQGVNETLDAVMGPINEAAAVLERVAGRDLSARVMGDYRGDHARIKEALNAAVDNLDQALKQVSIASEQVASASNQISSGSQAVAQGASEQASALEEISSSLQEMASMTKQNAANAQEAQSMTDAARAAADRGVDSMRRLSEAIERIKASSDETAKIVKTIDEIAFQTNLLALNAAVEAARAGDAGKGFAVVAEEVRNLAMRSAEAAKNTANLIDESVSNAENGVTTNQEVFAQLGDINDQVRKVGEVMAEIAAASEQQSQGIDQVNSAVAEMDQVTQQNAANSEESASAAEELSGQAEELRGMVSRFSLTGGEQSASLPPAPQPTASRKVSTSKAARGAAARKPARDPQAAIPLPGDNGHGSSTDDHVVLQEF
jgi:methyl-accepting chemotaxis protein